MGCCFDLPGLFLLSAVVSSPLLQDVPLPREPFPNKKYLTNPDDKQNGSFHHRALHHARMVIFCSCGDRKTSVQTWGKGNVGHNCEMQTGSNVLSRLGWGFDVLKVGILALRWGGLRKANWISVPWSHGTEVKIYPTDKITRNARTHLSLYESPAFFILGVFDFFENVSQRSHAFLNLNQVCKRNPGR